MKQIFISFLFLLFCFDGFGQWEKISLPIHKYGKTYFIRQFGNDDYWIGTEYGVFRSTNALKWSKVNDLPEAEYYDAINIGKQVFIAYKVGNLQYWVYSSDGGVNWKTQTISSTFNKFKFFIFKNDIFCSTDNNYFKFVNNSFTGEPNPFQSNTLDFNNSIYAYYSSTTNSMYISINKGLSFSSSFLLSSTYSPSKIIIAGNVILMNSFVNNKVYYSDDLGKSWKDFNYPYNQFSTLKKVGEKYVFDGKELFEIENDKFIKAKIANNLNNTNISDIFESPTNIIITDDKGVNKANKIDNQATFSSFIDLQVLPNHIIGNNENLIVIPSNIDDFIISKDKGNSWSYIATNCGNNMKMLASQDGEKIVCQCGKNKIFYSIDKGNSWLEKETPLDIVNIFIDNKKDIYAFCTTNTYKIEGDKLISTCKSSCFNYNGQIANVLDQYYLKSNAKIYRLNTNFNWIYWFDVSVLTNMFSTSERIFLQTTNKTDWNNGTSFWQKATDNIPFMKKAYNLTEKDLISLSNTGKFYRSSDRGNNFSYDSTLGFDDVFDFNIYKNLIFISRGKEGIFYQESKNTTATSESSTNTEKLLLFPNPTSEKLYLKLPNQNVGSLKYFISTIDGKTTMKGTISNDCIDVAELQNGVYFLQINDGEKNYIDKFVKINE